MNFPILFFSLLLPFLSLFLGMQHGTVCDSDKSLFVPPMKVSKSSESVAAVEGI